MANENIWGGGNATGPTSPAGQNVSHGQKVNEPNYWIPRNPTGFNTPGSQPVKRNHEQWLGEFTNAIGPGVVEQYAERSKWRGKMGAEAQNFLNSTTQEGVKAQASGVSTLMEQRAKAMAIENYNAALASGAPQSTALRAKLDSLNNARSEISSFLSALGDPRALAESRTQMTQAMSNMATDLDDMLAMFQLQAGIQANKPKGFGLTEAFGIVAPFLNWGSLGSIFK